MSAQPTKPQPTLGPGAVRTIDGERCRYIGQSLVTDQGTNQWCNLFVTAEGRVRALPVDNSEGRNEGRNEGVAPAHEPDAPRFENDSSPHVGPGSRHDAPLPHGRPASPMQQVLHRHAARRHAAQRNGFTNDNSTTSTPDRKVNNGNTVQPDCHTVTINEQWLTNLQHWPHRSSLILRSLLALLPVVLSLSVSHCRQKQKEQPASTAPAALPSIVLPLP